LNLLYPVSNIDHPIGVIKLVFKSDNENYTLQLLKQ